MNYNQNYDKYNEEIRKVEPTDPAHADLINELAQAIINNIAFNRHNIEQHESEDNPHGITATTIGLGELDNTKDVDKPVSNAQQDAIDKAYYNSNLYTDEKIADLINGAPSTLDTLGEIAKAFEDNKSVVEALNQAVGTKANEKEFTSHTNNKSNPHGVTAAQLSALKTNGDSKACTTTFTSNDTTDANATAWTTVPALTSGLTHATFFQRISQMFKNIRYLYKILGTTDISAIGDGTVTGAINLLNSDLATKLLTPSFKYDYALLGGIQTRAGTPVSTTIDKDGWYYADCQSETDDIGDMRIYINGNIVIAQTYTRAQWTKITSGMMYLKKGTTVTYTCSNNVIVACFLSKIN